MPINVDLLNFFSLLFKHYFHFHSFFPLPWNDSIHFHDDQPESFSSLLLRSNFNNISNDEYIIIYLSCLLFPCNIWINLFLQQLEIDWDNVRCAERCSEFSCFLLLFLLLLLSFPSININRLSCEFRSTLIIDQFTEFWITTIKHDLCWWTKEEQNVYVVKLFFSGFTDSCLCCLVCKTSLTFYREWTTKQNCTITTFSLLKYWEVNKRRRWEEKRWKRKD